MRHGRRDVNHAAIRDGLRDVVGKQRVLDTADVGDGFPDLVVHLKGTAYFFEIKQRSRTGKVEPLTAAEARWHRDWDGGRLYVVTSLQEALYALGMGPRLPAT